MAEGRDYQLSREEHPEWIKKNGWDHHDYQTKADKNNYFAAHNFNDRDPSDWTNDEIEQFYNWYNNDVAQSLKDENTHLRETYDKVAKRYEQVSFMNHMLEMQEMTAEYMRKAAEAAAYQLPYQQPASEAQQTYSAAQSDSLSRQNLRRGLLSLTRYGSNSSTSASGLSGKSSRLGG